MMTIRTMRSAARAAAMVVLAISAGAWAQNLEAADGGSLPSPAVTQPMPSTTAAHKVEPLPQAPVEPTWSLAAGVGLATPTSYLGGGMVGIVSGGAGLAAYAIGYPPSSPSVPVSLAIERRLTGPTWLVLRASASTSSAKYAPDPATSSWYSSWTTIDASTTWDGALALGARYVLNAGALVEVSGYAELAAARSSTVSHSTTTTATSQTPPASTVVSGISTSEGTTYGGAAGLIAEHALTPALSIRLDLRVVSGSVSTISSSSAADDGTSSSSSSRSSRAGLDLSPALQLRLQW